MTIINDNLPTSTLLEIKIGEVITNGKGQSGTVKSIEISETDEFLMFLFQLETGYIIVKKLKQVC
ncbi:hypothetical protein J7E50_11170 [Pedobacter sp. ISL-68]|uniref:hypothetical protein n=1 Tax=unclassified Pedobacter TaxID=2628915 RepID=UPI001BE8D918|nr:MULTISPECIES: hypothetical protein [unclassified Pedobacter]MBT2561394.1 hypothetical protein [Pedobacter sp. ISL-64]MBT2590783.1 hypothetical protein [Pedobacter sp. ISL-68]